MTGTSKTTSTEEKANRTLPRAGAIGGFVIGIAALVFRPIKHRAEAHTTERGNTLLLNDVSGALSAAEITGIQAAFGGAQPVGKFLRGRHGVTHYYLQSPESRGTAQTSLNKAGASRLIVMAHGLGTNMNLYDEVVGPLLDDGFTILRYDYFGHGWSAPDDKYYSPLYPTPCLYPTPSA